MKDPDKVVDIVRQMVDALNPLPVTCKIRLQNMEIISRNIGEITGRYLCAKAWKLLAAAWYVYMVGPDIIKAKISKADLDAIRSIKRCVTSMPIISNGNIGSPIVLNA